MVSYKKDYEYDIDVANRSIEALRKENDDLKKKIKIHSDLKSRELHIRQQEKNLKTLLIDTTNAVAFMTLKDIIRKNEFLKDEWLRLMVYIKLTVDPEEFIKLSSLFDE